jgi:hypothetical protein
VNRQATLAVARGAQRMLVKTGDTVTRLDGPFTDADVTRHLVHEDGFLRVPVLLIGDLLVRGYTEELYRAALDRSTA